MDKKFDNYHVYYTIMQDGWDYYHRHIDIYPSCEAAKEGSRKKCDEYIHEANLEKLVDEVSTKLIECYKRIKVRDSKLAKAPIRMRDVDCHAEVIYDGKCIKLCAIEPNASEIGTSRVDENGVWHFISDSPEDAIQTMIHQDFFAKNYSIKGTVSLKEAHEILGHQMANELFGEDKTTKSKSKKPVSTVAKKPSKDTSPILGYGIIDRKGYLNGGKYGLVLFPTMQAAEAHSHNPKFKPEPVTEQDVITLMTRLEQHSREKFVRDFNDGLPFDIDPIKLKDVNAYVHAHYTNGNYRFGEIISFNVINDGYYDEEKIDYAPDGHVSWNYSCKSPKEAVSKLKSNAVTHHFFEQNVQPVKNVQSVKKARKVKTDIPDFVEDTSIAAKGHDGMSL